MVYRRNAEMKKIVEKYVRKKEKGKIVSTDTDEEWEEQAVKEIIQMSLEGSLMLVFPCVLIFEIIEHFG